jgi:hypothetical protein
MSKSKMMLGGILRAIGATGTVAVDNLSRGAVAQQKPKKKGTGEGCTPCAAAHRAAKMYNNVWGKR